ncbi:MAG: uroporphyrinogen-III C-methyltransferase [Betaproteobacteria bacterium]
MGTVYLIGAGPGAPDLLTLRAARILERADIVFHDALVHPEVLSMASCARIVPVGKRCSRISTDQRFINRNLVEAASRHEVVVRLKGGDPMIFGRAQEEIDALVEAGIQYEIVPGVTAALSASAELGISLTQRGVSRSVVFATPRTRADVDGADRISAWAKAVAAADTAVLYMSRGQAPALVHALQAAGLSANHPAAIVENASLPNARHHHGTLADLPNLAAQTGDGPALVILGDVLRASVEQHDVFTADEQTSTSDDRRAAL